MKLKRLGKNISEIEIHTTINGLWLLVDGKEYFLSYKDYPWFKKSTVAELHNVSLLHRHHLHWPDLDIDLDLDSLEHPGRYPLKSQ